MDPALGSGLEASSRKNSTYGEYNIIKPEYFVYPVTRTGRYRPAEGSQVSIPAPNSRRWSIQDGLAAFCCGVEAGHFLDLEGLSG